MWVMESAAKEIESRVAALTDSIKREEERVADLRKGIDGALADIKQMKLVREQYKLLGVHAALHAPSSE